ncbi:FIST signal transduction protein [Polaribacter sp. IC073]|uniref:FIST signal transduction protein n=1 Tax=Polaribacter sp. IC073 TaxID=2508540 RepID=UPI0011BE82FB|nr:FIST N-terminal domain-containing protein [Polaribacter sp. IC073]TXD49167.1 histidine kinase [Polaribacter sp. IC073]
MKIVQLKRGKGEDWEYLSKKLTLKKPLVLVFGNRYLLENSEIYNEIKDLFKDGEIIFGSTSGDITSKSVDDNCITITAIEFERSSFLVKTSNILKSKEKLDSFKAGKDLIKQFPQEGLKHVFIISEGSFINGSQLSKGMNAATDNNLLITGALCGDAARFEKTISSYNENPKQGEIIAIGLYGETLEVSFSINGGWTPFGPERTVTKSKDNILFELDDKPALDLYKKYLGDKSKELPGAALLYPLKVKSTNEKQSIVRTILNINEEENSMILAGDILENSKVQLMMTNVDNIVDAAQFAAESALEFRTKKPELAILVSCIGRKLVLDQRVEEEVEEVMEVVGDTTTICGLYSYGEIAPFHGENNCQLHNQTMTITLISE